jgi:hypothetical protein
MITKAKEENSCVTLEIKKGILFAHYKNVTVDLQKAIELVEFRHKYCEYKKYLIMISGSSAVTINKEARQYLASEEAQKNVIACAIHANNFFFMSLANFFLKINSGISFPCKVFTDREAALKWLKTYDISSKN